MIDRLTQVIVIAITTIFSRFGGLHCLNLDMAGQLLLHSRFVHYYVGVVQHE